MDSLVEKNQQLENMVSYLTNELEKKVKENIELQNICDKLNKNLYVYEELTKEYTINKSFLEDQILKQKTILKLQDTVFKLRETVVNQRENTNESPILEKQQLKFQNYKLNASLCNDNTQTP